MHIPLDELPQRLEEIPGNKAIIAFCSSVFRGPFAGGVLAGFVSGLLGVGGGGIISPLMILQGFNPKKVATVTAFSVPFSSLSAFITYAAMGSISIKILIFAGLAAWAGGYLGTKVMQKKCSPTP